MSTALITGATSGIGHAMATTLSDAGFKVIALGRRRETLEGMRSAHPDLTPIAVDITDRQALKAAVAGLQVDVLINNAGMMPPLCNFADMDDADIDATLELNLHAPIRLTRLLVPQMRERRDGHIFFTGSIAGHAAFSNIAVYCATKAGLAGFAASLRADLSGYGIRVTEIVAGRVETQLYDAILDAEARRRMYANPVPQPQDVAQMVLAVLALPRWADVTRFDIMPTLPVSPSGTK